MLPRRTAAPSVEPVAAPDSTVGDRSAVRAASGHESPIPSPVHTLQAELAEGLDPVRRRLDPGKAIVAATLAIYTAAFWWGVASFGSSWLRHLAHH